MKGAPAGSPHIDVFCAVIDNFGDAGVCWRLARQLAAEHGAAVRLWMDRPDVLLALEPAFGRSGTCGGVVLADWQAAALATPAELEGFGCTLPEAFRRRMAAMRPQPVWIDLEYLSAEDWVEGCHRLGSLLSHGVDRGLVRHFFFPGFTPRTGGLLREAALDVQRTAFQADVGRQDRFWQALGLAPPAHGLRCSLFSYENAALPGLLAAWRDGDVPLYCVVPQGRVLPPVNAWLHAGGFPPLAPGGACRTGALTLVAVPFLQLDAYDRLLWACDLNFVRGEDSFIRAQWARRPLVWHIYPQDQRAHVAKLDAFLGRYETGLGAAPRAALRNFWQAWDAQAGAGPRWSALVRELPALRAHATVWAQQLAALPDLAGRLLSFVRELRQ